MASSTLQSALRAGTVVDQAWSVDEVKDALARPKKLLADLSNPKNTLSTESRFDLAYNAGARLPANGVANEGLPHHHGEGASGGPLRIDTGARSRRGGKPGDPRPSPHAAQSASPATSSSEDRKYPAIRSQLAALVNRALRSDTSNRSRREKCR